MPFTYRDKPKLSDRFRGKTGEEILSELKSDLGPSRRMFFDAPSWTTRHNNGSGFPRGFPFDDDRNRTDIRSYLDEIATRHPEFAEHFREPGWNEDFPSSSVGRKRRGSNSERESEFPPKAAGPAPQPPPNYSEVQEPQQNLTNYGLRNTVPLGPGAAVAEEERRQRSMSAPPDDRAPNKPKRYITKCEIPVMHDPTKEPKPDSGVKVNQENVQQKSNNAPNVRVIPIQVEGRDTPLVNTNIDTSTNFGETYGTPKDGMFEGRLPRDFGSYQKHSPRFAHKERSTTPPQFQQYAPHYQYMPPPHQGFMPGPQHQYMPQQQQFGPPPQPQPHSFAQQQPQRPQAPPPPQQQHHQQHQQQPQQQHQKPAQAPRPPSAQSQNDEIDSRRSPQPQPKPEPIKDPIEKVQLIQKEVEELMKQVESFKGNSRTDKQYLTLDELLTRQLLLLDNIDTEGKENVRQARKDTIRSIQRCISTLENKVPLEGNKEGTSEPQGGETGEAKPGAAAAEGASAVPQAMEVVQTKENTPVENKENQSMEVDVKETAGSMQTTEENVQPKV